MSASRHTSAANPPGSGAAPTRSLTQRSRVTNGSVDLHGLNPQSPTGRRLRVLIELLGAELGGPTDHLTLLAIKNAALAQVNLEMIQARALTGGSVSSEDLIRSQNAASRTLAALRGSASGRRRKPAGEALREHLARLSAERDTGPP